MKMIPMGKAISRPSVRSFKLIVLLSLLTMVDCVETG